ncbi:MAG: PEGA domain-containing protein, partial [Bacteroidales bacterium]|nr:PEGA domain-containing protein [Bacteroidales bacterium]
MKKIFAFFLFVVMCLSTFFISAKDNNVLKYDGSEEVATDTIKNKKKKSVDEIEDEDVLMLEPSSLVIQTVPKKAKVYIDDELRGTTPLKIKNIVPDKYEIRIEKKGYEEIRETISIDEGEDFVFDEILNEIVEIEPETAAVENTEDVATEEIKEKKTKKSKSSLYVETTPKKAEVYIDEELEGTTPLKIKDIMPSEYEIRIEKNGYEEIVKTISISEGEKLVLNETLNEIIVEEPEIAAVENTEDVATEEIKEKKTKKSKSSLYVETVPKKADVYLNDDLKGTSPLKIKNLTPDEYDVRIEKKGFEDIYLTISIAEDEAFMISDTLQEIVGEIAEEEVEKSKDLQSNLTIQSFPKKANVYIDDELKGKTPLKIKDIMPSEYEVRIEKENYMELKKTIIIPEGQTFISCDTLVKISDYIEEQFVLGKNYFDGNGVDNDYEKALEYFNAAAELGHVEACVYIADCYHHGHGVEENHDLAIEWYSKAAE